MGRAGGGNEGMGSREGTSVEGRGTVVLLLLGRASIGLGVAPGGTVVACTGSEGQTGAGAGEREGGGDGCKGAAREGPQGAGSQKGWEDVARAGQGWKYQWNCWQRLQGYGGLEAVSYARPEAAVKMVWPVGRMDTAP